MNDGPMAHEIVASVAQWLDGGASGADGFHGKVAANALKIVVRELRDGPAIEARAIARLATITGQAGSFAMLESALCEMIERGHVAITDAPVREHLRATARDRLAIDQPNYRSLLG